MFSLLCDLPLEKNVLLLYDLSMDRYIVRCCIICLWKGEIFSLLYDLFLTLRNSTLLMAPYMFRQCQKDRSLPSLSC